MVFFSLLLNAVLLGAVSSGQSADSQIPADIQLTLPPDVYAVVGQETGIWFDNIVLTEHPEALRFQVKCDRGITDQKHWVLTPQTDDVGIHSLSVTVMDAAGEKVLGKAETRLHVSAPLSVSNSEKALRLLFVGDSLTHATVYPNELARLLSEPGNPGWKMYGTHRPDTAAPGVAHEGYGGWTWRLFNSHYEPSPDGTYRKRSSPFVFANSDGTPELNVGRYLREACEGQSPDYVIFFLGINDCFGANPDDPDAIDSTISAMLQHAETLLTAFRKAAPESRLVICVTPPANARESGFEANYQGRYRRWGWKRIQHRLVERQLKHFSGREADKILFIPTQLNIDPADGYPDNNGVHPNSRGYQIASTIYAWLVDDMARDSAFPALQSQFDAVIQPMLKQYCLDCHSTELREGELDLQRFGDLAEVRRYPTVWQKVAEMLDSGEMPPKDSPQPGDAERKHLRSWVANYLNAEAIAGAGDPGPVVLRRLSNAEYTCTIQDLTRTKLMPAREFPADGAAGEGFTNTGNSLVMSPALVTKYLDAAKVVAGHAVLLPDGFRFSPHNTRNDWTNDSLDRIREFYRVFTDGGGGDQVNLQGIVFDTNADGRLPLTACLKALLAERERLLQGESTTDEIAARYRLSPKYLRLLWETLNATHAADDPADSILLRTLRSQWQSAKPGDADSLAAGIAVWQQSLWRFTTVGHIGKLNGPKAWMEPVSPLAARQEIRVAMPTTASPGEEVTLYLAAGDAGDGRTSDFAVWEHPRLVAPGRPDLLLRDVREVTGQLAAKRHQIFSTAALCLEAAAEISALQESADLQQLATKYKVEPESLVAWFDYLGIGTSGAVKLGPSISGRMESGAGYEFIRGWMSNDALSVVANSSDQHVRIPGNMKPHSIAVHPAPTLSVAIGWRSPVTASVQIEGSVQHAHPECGNGVAWAVELRRGNTRQRLATGISQGAAVVPIQIHSKTAVQKEDVICLVISPRDGNHSCDLTAVDLILRSDDRQWNLAGDVSPDILAGNPHADSYGTPDVWHFFSEPTSGTTGHVVPAGSLLAKWQAAGDAETRKQLAAELQTLLQNGVTNIPVDAPDAVLYRQLTSFSGPLLSAALSSVSAQSGKAPESGSSSAAPQNSKQAVGQNVKSEDSWGLDAGIFGKHPVSGNVEPSSLCVQAPTVTEIRLPADLVAGSEFVTTATLHTDSGSDGSVQMQVLTTKPKSFEGLQPTTATPTAGTGPWTSNTRGIAFASPVIVADDSDARRRFENAFEEFRQLFPAALCYTKIVPVDEVVTLTLFYREDDHLQRLMLNDEQIQKLNQLWDELHFISQDALTLVDAYAQLMEYATQDADPSVFEPLRKPINDRADAFRRLLVDSEPSHVNSVVEFAEQAFRRPLSIAEADQLRSLYSELRRLELPHSDAIRTLLARVLVSPAFLYRVETPGEGTQAAPVSDWELASRLSYFLWSSQPDEQLRELAAAGKLRDPDVLRQQTRRMMDDEKIRRLSIEFACQWLHVYDFDQLDEKSERHFPTFLSVREPMYEEVIQFFTDIFRRDGSVMEVFSADHTFVNDQLAPHYGISDVTGGEWRRIDNASRYSRGGILTMGATLAKQSGASRTSPILRGNWLSEVILGEKLPKPPKGVPPLPEDETGESLTVRQQVERHSTDPKCASCHQRIDPLGFALEGFDAIGRARTMDSAGRQIDTNTVLMDGTAIDGLTGLQRYLTETRRDAVLRQFCRKLLGYSLGRAVKLSDEPLLSEMQKELARNDYRISIAVEQIVLSPQFREIRGREAAIEESLE